MLLASRRINYKVLMKDCLYTVCSLSQDYAGNHNKPSVRTLRSSGPSEDSTFLGILKSFLDSSSTSIIKNLNVEVVQLLLAHAFLEKKRNLVAREKEVAYTCFSAASFHHAAMQ